MRRAFELAPPTRLARSADGYHVRAAAPLLPLPASHTVYVEPATPTRTPGRLALELQRTLPPALAPVRYTHEGRTWTLVVLGGAAGAALGRRECWPPGWIVLAK